MYTFVLIIHVLLAATLVILVLLQQGKGADAGAVMGGGGANTVFGVGGASSLLVRLTTFIAIMFMLTSVGLVKLALGGGAQIGAGGNALSGSVLDSVSKDATQAGAPAAPAEAGSEQKNAQQAPAPVDGANVPQ